MHYVSLYISNFGSHQGCLNNKALTSQKHWNVLILNENLIRKSQKQYINNIQKYIIKKTLGILNIYL